MHYDGAVMVTNFEGMYYFELGYLQPDYTNPMPYDHPLDQLLNRLCFHYQMVLVCLICADRSSLPINCYQGSCYGNIDNRLKGLTRLKPMQAQMKAMKEEVIAAEASKWTTVARKPKVPIKMSRIQGNHQSQNRNELYETAKTISQQKLASYQTTLKVPLMP